MRTQVTILLALITMLMNVGGCGFGDKVIVPIRLDDPPNTFGLSEKRWGGHITEVKVWKDRPQGEILWELKPTGTVPVTGFTVTIGETPERFVQSIPSPPEKFRPVPGSTYWIGINAMFAPHAWPIEVKWKAE